MERLMPVIRDVADYIEEYDIGWGVGTILLASGLTGEIEQILGRERAKRGETGFVDGMVVALGKYYDQQERAVRGNAIITTSG